MPKGDGFVEFPDFENGYEALKRATWSFREVTPDTVAPVVFETPIALIVLRCMLGFTPSEWAYHASRHTGVNVTQSAARTIDRSIRMRPDGALSKKGRVTERRIRALVAAACHTLRSGVPEDSPDSIHRLDKADTRAGLISVQSSAELGIPYSILLYERLLGRPFAGHRGLHQRTGRQPRRERHRGCTVPRRHQLSQDEAGGAIARIRPGARFRDSQRVQSASRHRGEAHRRRRHGPRQGDASSAPRHAEHGRPAAGSARVRGGRLHRWTGLRRTPRGHEKAAARDARQGIHAAERASACGAHAIDGVSVEIGASRGRRWWTQLAPCSDWSRQEYGRLAAPRIQYLLIGLVEQLVLSRWMAEEPADQVVRAATRHSCGSHRPSRPACSRHRP